MIRRLSQADEIAGAESLRNLVAASETTFAPQWLAQSGARVVAQESGRHLEADEAPLVANAFSNAGVGSLLAVINDSLVVAPEAYALAASVDDLNQLSSELVGMNFVLLDPVGRLCILFTAYDFKLVAGAPSFLHSVVGDPVSARAAFLGFVEDQPGALRATAGRAAEYMSWMDALG